MRGRDSEVDRKSDINKSLRKVMKCLGNGEPSRRADDFAQTKDYSASINSCQARLIDKKLDIGNIEEAESSLCDGGCLSYEVDLFRILHLICIYTLLFLI